MQLTIENLTVKYGTEVATDQGAADGQRRRQGGYYRLQRGRKEYFD